MKYYFDRIENDIVIPNGLVSNKLLNLYKNNIKTYKNNCPLRVPHLIKWLSLEYEILTKNSVGFYAIDIEEPCFISYEYCNYLFNECISNLAKNKILKGDLKLIIFLHRYPSKDYELKIIYDTLTDLNFDNFVIYSFNNINNDKRIKTHFLSELNLYLEGTGTIWRGRFDDINHDYHDDLRAYSVAYSKRHNYDYRVAAFYYIIKKKLDKKCILSLNKELKTWKKFTENAESINKLVNSDECDKLMKQKTYDKIDFHTLKKLKLSLIPESYFGDNIIDYPLITEKTIKPIAFKQIFLILGQKNSLDEVRKRGYKTFHPFVDESYDAITSNSKRFFILMKEFERILNLSSKEYDKLIHNTSDIVNFNFQLFQKKSKEGIKELGGFDEYNL